jgi:internalin A
VAREGRGLSRIWEEPRFTGTVSGVRSRTMKERFGRVLFCVGLLGLTGCDEQPKAETKASEVKTAEPAATPPPPAPEPAPEPAVAKKPKKTLADCDKGSKVTLDNAEFEGAVRVKAQKPDGDLTTADLKKLRSLNLSRVQLTELDVCLFRHMTELRELFIGPGEIDDLSSIVTSTKLESLGVSGNPITDLSPLSKMTKMDRLDVAHTKITDISALSAMKALTELNIDDTQVTDLSPLKDLTKLERLSLKKTKVSDVSVLAEHKELKFVYVGESPLAEESSKTAILSKNGAKIIDE